MHRQLSHRAMKPSEWQKFSAHRTAPIRNNNVSGFHLKIKFKKSFETCPYKYNKICTFNK